MSSVTIVVYAITNTLLFRCVEKISGRIEVDVPGSYCDPADLPAEEADCTLYCPDECVFSDWTEWSSCQSVSFESRWPGIA